MDNIRAELAKLDGDSPEAESYRMCYEALAELHALAQQIADAEQIAASGKMMDAERLAVELELSYRAACARLSGVIRHGWRTQKRGGAGEPTARVYGLAAAHVRGVNWGNHV